MPIHANPVERKQDPAAIPPAPVPSQVRRSNVPDPEETRGKTGDKTQFRKRVEATQSEVKEEPAPEPTKPVFTRTDEPVVKGTIVITVYENRPYDVEFSGHITGAERDLAWRAMMKQYAVWKAKLAKQQEKELKAKEEQKKEEK
ncbi:MAG: hypothetical protein AM326_10975 [Candidatus Thorarchaeota archaeon SMTZ-45]|nr:MAG: hypothetical protein AM326_10975 [Candidatus Thorarchaeota archaeon SMTZ-45]